MVKGRDRNARLPCHKLAHILAHHWHHWPILWPKFVINVPQHRPE